MNPEEPPGKATPEEITDIISELPAELLTKIAEYLTDEAFGRLCSVNKYYQDVFSGDNDQRKEWLDYLAGMLEIFKQNANGMDYDDANIDVVLTALETFNDYANVDWGDLGDQVYAQHAAVTECITSDVMPWLSTVVDENVAERLQERYRVMAYR
jgi:hypothetical protein